MYYSTTCTCGMTNVPQRLVVYMTPSNYAIGIIMPRIDNTETFKNASDRLEDGLSSSNCGGVGGGKAFAGEQFPTDLSAGALAVKANHKGKLDSRAPRIRAHPYDPWYLGLS